MRTATALAHTDSSIVPFNTLWNGVDGNYDTTRNPIKGVIFHTMQGFMAGTLSTFRNRVNCRSAHYGVSQKGEIVLYVPENFTAYGAGNYSYNQSYINIETEDLNQPVSVRPDELYKACAALLYDAHKSYGFPLDRSAVLIHHLIPDPKVPGKTIGQTTGRTCPGNLDVDRIVREAQALAQADIPAASVVPQLSVITDDHALIDIGFAPYGTQELQAVRSMLRDKDREIQGLQSSADQINQAKGPIAALARLFGIGN